MATASSQDPLRLLRGLFRAHPWHGVPIGTGWPALVTVYLEIVPTDTIKYEVDKPTGHLKIDRPQRYSNVCPAPYGFIPQTYCAERTGELASERTGRPGIAGDGDPLDICVLTEKSIAHGDILLQARPIGGLRVLDGSEADDKILAVLEGDAAYGDWVDIESCPTALVARLEHYFLAYKEGPDRHGTGPVEITHIYGKDEAHEVIRRTRQDYLAHYGDLDGLLRAVLEGGS